MEDVKAFVYGLAALGCIAIAIAFLIALQASLALIGWIVFYAVLSIGAAATVRYLVLPILHSGADLIIKLANTWLDARLKLSRVPLDDNGNAPALIGMSPEQVLILPHGQYKEYPALSSLHLHNAAPKMIEQPQEEQEPREAIPAVVRYEDIAHEVPAALSLLGIHPHNGNLEIVPPENYKTAWFVGGSNMGKTNTVYGKVADMVGWGAGLIICDPHAHKPDSLTNKLQDFHHALILPIAQSDSDIYRALLTFLDEFRARRDEGKPSAKKWLIVVDEVNGLARHTVKIDGKEVKMQSIVQELAETCGYEARGFEMFGYFISQKAAGLSWLRNAMMTVFVHGLLMESEALLAANNNRNLARQVMDFKKGRTLVYGYEIDSMILQQPLYGRPKDDHPASYPGNSDDVPAVAYPTMPDLPMKNSPEDNGEGSGRPFSGNPTKNLSSTNQAANAAEDDPEGNGEGSGRSFFPGNVTHDFELKKMLLDIKKMSDEGMSNDAILKHFGLQPGGRQNQNLKIVLTVLSDLEREANSEN